MVYRVRREKEFKTYMKNLARLNGVLPKEEEYYSGCNYSLNFGTNVYEPFGTARSNHSCSGCSVFSSCTIKKSSRVWFTDMSSAESQGVG